MCNPPKKPHFFTFVSPHPHSQNGSLIPLSFMSKYFNGEKCGNALLKRGCKTWNVKICGRRFVNGWEKFEKENGLELGDFIVFRHEGNFVFHVLVFDPTLCEKIFPPLPTTTVNAKKMTTPEAQTESLKEIPKNIKVTSNGMRDKTVKVHNIKKTSTTKHGNQLPSFSATLTRHGFEKSYLYVPAKFARLNGWRNKQHMMIIRDERLRPWSVKLRYNQDCIIGQGWRNFCIGNGLRQGDEFILELVENGVNPVMNFYLKRKSVKTCTREDTKSTAFTGGSCPYFVATINEYSTKKSALYLPNNFARKNRLCSGEMILRNCNQSSWLVEVRDIGKYVYIARGWRDFQVANNLKKGDFFKFELVEKGKIPTVNFSRIENIEDNAPKAENQSGDM